MSGLSIFEIGMLISFGISWPANIVKSLRSRSVKGKSLFFLYAVLAGYVFGILHKIFFRFDLVLVLYIVNFLMVAFDIFLYYRNRAYERNLSDEA